MADHEVTEPKKFDVEAIWYRGQRVLRTALTTALTLLPLIPQIIQIVQGQWPAATGLTAVGVQALAINSALTAIIALPTVNRWLTAIGFGSTPRAVAKEQAAAKSQALQPAQFAPSTLDLRNEQAP
ncbi:hypothetical protein E9228_002964 [Curtobacterium flaccumfaciens]|uniref:Holin n=1 Tax=Curtobacterium salicis TaxID=1779862 RepID=A0ABX0TCX3_9MICO|nr:hypothetical protein [Curtobacterium sp. WW7]NII42306.1 hypothetical protein [Curtobacterium sp. WW7]